MKANEHKIYRRKGEKHMSISNVKWIRTDNPDWKFEDNPIGRIKKEIWDADEAQLDKWLKEDFEIPSPSEIGKANCYVQTTPRYILKKTVIIMKLEK